MKRSLVILLLWWLGGVASAQVSPVLVTDQTMTGKASITSPLSVRVATGGGLSTGGGVGGLSLSTGCPSGHNLRYSVGGWICGNPTDDGSVFTVTEPVITAAINGAVVATVHTSAGIQAAIDAATDGGTVLMESGAVYAITATINITKRMIIIDCQGWPHNGGLQVDAGMSTSSPVFLIQPPAGITNQGVVFRNCMIMSVSGAPASAGIAIDGTFGNVGYLVLDHVWINHLGGPAIKVQNASGLATGTPYNTHITNASILDNGADFTNGGDSISIDGGSILTGAGSLIVDTVGGNFMMDHVTSILGGGIIIRRALAGIISHSNIEQTVTSTEANNCMIDVQGSASVGLFNFVIEDNDLQANSAFVGCAIRVDHATHTQIVRNYTVQGSVNSYTITANADRTVLDHNRAAPDNVVSSFLSNAGTNTTGTFVNQTSGATSVLGLMGFSSAAGTTGVAISSAQVKVNPTNGTFAVSTGDPTTTGTQVALWSSGANAWRMGTAFGDGSANLGLGTLDVAGAATADGAKRLFDIAGTGLTSSANTVSLAINSGSTQTCAAGSAVTAVTGAGITTCAAFGSGSGTVTGTGTANTTAKWTGTSAIGNAWALDDATTWGVASKFTIAEASGNFRSFGTGTIDGAALMSSTAHIVGAATLDSTITATQMSVGSTTLAPMLGVQLANASSGVSPSSWNGQWATFGPAVGASGAALGIGYNTGATIGVIYTCIAPGSAFKACTFNGNQFTFDVAGTAAFTLDTSGNAAFADAVTHSTTTHLVGATTEDSTLKVTGLATIGPGADAPTVASAAAIFENAGTTSIAVRDATHDIEFFVTALATGGVKLGTSTNDVLSIGANNGIAIGIDTAENIDLVGAFHDQSAAPTPSVCGTGPAVAGGQTNGHVTPGSSAGSTCTITMAKTIVSCVVTTPGSSPDAYSIAGAAITATNALSGIQPFDFFCTF